MRSITMSREPAALYATETLNGPLCGIVIGERAMTRISLPVDPPEVPVPVVDPEGPVVAVPVVALAVVVPVVAGPVVAVPVVALPVVEGPVVEVPLATLASQQVVYGASPELKIQYHWKVYVPSVMVDGRVKHPVHNDLSIFSQNFEQFWNPLKSITPLT
jgi:hypothetical protein